MLAGTSAGWHTAPVMTDTQPYGTYAPAGLVAAITRRTNRIPADSWHGRRLALFLRRIAISMLGGKPLDVTRYGARMRLHPYNNNCEKKVLFTPQFFDPEERAILERRLPQDCVFLDIGANVGAYALCVAAFSGPGARIVAVEPQPDVFDRLSYNIAQNPFHTIKAVACAVADKAGELTLFIDPRNRGESSLRIVGTNEGARITVPAVPLLDLLNAEGLTLEPFLRQAPESLLPRFLLIENGTGQWQLDLPEHLKAYGYRELKRSRLNLMFERG